VEGIAHVVGDFAIGEGKSDVASLGVGGTKVVEEGKEFLGDGGVAGVEEEGEKKRD
jgi:hypothetical protein